MGAVDVAARIVPGRIVGGECAFGRRGELFETAVVGEVDGRPGRRRGLHRPGGTHRAACR